MAEEIPSKIKRPEHAMAPQCCTLAIDLGNSTTVVALQGELEAKPILLELPPISRFPGEVPSLVWQNQRESANLLIGQQVLELGLTAQDHPSLCRDFKRWIGAPTQPNLRSSFLSAERAGELLLRQIWHRVPSNLEINRLVLTAPINTYRAYRNWLLKVCSELEVKEIALVDEPTAAAMGAGLPPGSKLLVVDVGGSTIDISLVALEGGEGRADPVAQLLRFNGEDLEGKSSQVLRCAKVLGKAGLRLGGRDFDKWIAGYLYPNLKQTELILNAAERLKCRLSKDGLKETEVIYESLGDSSTHNYQRFELNKKEFEKLLIERGFLKSLAALLEQTLANGRANGCNLEDLNGVVVVGGGARIPLIRQWLEEHTKPAPLLTPPPVEAVALGALNLTPGVRVRDVLHKGVWLRCWDQRSQKHMWHPLFLAGQPWPTSNPLEIVLAGNKENQSELELVIGEPENLGKHEVVYVNGIPTVKTNPVEPELIPWSDDPVLIGLNPPGNPGEDLLNLRFSINEHSYLEMEGKDLRTGKELIKQNLGSVR